MESSEIEMEWVNAWSDLYELVKEQWDVRCMLPDYSVVSVEECKSWLQDSAYEGFHVSVRAGFVLGRPGIVATRWPVRDSASAEPSG